MKTPPVTRREFAAQLGALPLAAGAATHAAAAAKRAPCAARGIVGVTRGPKDLEAPPSTPAGATWRYQLVYPFQVAPRLAGLSCSIKPNFGPGQDWENGLDLVLFDDLDRIRAEGAITVTRNHEEPNPNAGGKLAVSAPISSASARPSVTYFWFEFRFSGSGSRRFTHRPTSAISKSTFEKAEAIARILAESFRSTFGQ